MTHRSLTLDPFSLLVKGFQLFMCIWFVALFLNQETNKMFRFVWHHGQNKNTQTHTIKNLNVRGESWKLRCGHSWSNRWVWFQKLSEISAVLTLLLTYIHIIARRWNILISLSTSMRISMNTKKRSNEIFVFRLIERKKWEIKTNLDSCEKNRNQNRQKNKNKNKNNWINVC